MATSIEAIRAKLQEQADRAKGRQNGNSKTVRSTGDGALYPFYNMGFGETAVVRFLPDADPDNLFFWVPRETISLPFAGVVGGDYPTDKEVLVTVPCVNMFGDKNCPIIQGTKHLWGTKENPPSDAEKALARRYWKKKSYITQGFVKESPINEEQVPENPIRRFTLTPMVFDIIYDSIMKKKIEENPVDYVEGIDFEISKTKKGDFPNYGTSNWARRNRSLSDEERAAIDKYELWNLKDYLGTAPDADGKAAIAAMFEASFAGEPFDFVAFNKYGYRAYPNNRGGGGEGAELPRAAAKIARSNVPDTAPEADAEPASSNDVEAEAPSSTSDVLARIRARTAGKK